MLTFLEHTKIDLPPRVEFHKSPSIGWWQDGDHMTMYHGTHESRLADIAKNGLRAPTTGPTANWVSLTHDPHTAHGYASMTGGESAFRAAGAKARTVPHDERVVVVHKIPREWAEKNMSHELRGNIKGYSEKMSDKGTYDAHKAAGRPDHEHYAATELRFKEHVPPEFITGYMRKVDKKVDKPEESV